MKKNGLKNDENRNKYKILFRKCCSLNKCYIFAKIIYINLKVKNNIITGYAINHSLVS